MIYIENIEAVKILEEKLLLCNSIISEYHSKQNEIKEEQRSIFLSGKEIEREEVKFKEKMTNEFENVKNDVFVCDFELLASFFI